MEHCEIDKYFGSELVVNCSKGNDAVCNYEKIQAFIDDLLVVIEMEKKGDTTLGEVCVQLMKRGSIVFHFCDDSKNFYGNIFSCKKFSVVRVRECIFKHFEPKQIQELTLQRGL